MSEKLKRPIDELVKNSYDWWSKSFVFIKKTKVKTIYSVFILAFMTGVAVAIIWSVSSDVHQSSQAASSAQSKQCANYLSVADKYQKLATQYCAKARKNKKYQSKCNQYTAQAKNNRNLYSARCQKPLCSDSDNGKNYSVAGKVTGKPGEAYNKNTATDTCVDSNGDIGPDGYLLREYFLDNNCVIQYEDVNCENCVNGTCPKAEYGGRCVNDSMCGTGYSCKSSGRYPDMEKYCCKANECASVIPDYDPLVQSAPFHCVGEGGKDEAMSQIPTTLTCSGGQWVASTSTSPNCPAGTACSPDLYNPDGNGISVSSDYNYMKSCWWKSSSDADWSSTCQKVDFDGDAFVGPNDYNIFNETVMKYDLNKDGAISMATSTPTDYQVFYSCWLKTSSDNSWSDCQKSDFDNDNVVGFKDFNNIKAIIIKYDLNGDGIVSAQ